MPITAGGAVGLFEGTVARLTRVAAERRAEFAAMPAERSEHARAHATVPALRQIEIGGEAASVGPSATIRVAAWNLERGLYPDLAADALRRAGADLALLSELDCGMLRTGQRHVAADIATRLGQQYAYGLEFLELGTVPPPPGRPAAGTGNEQGFHGNAILTGLDLADPALIRLDEVGDWFVDPWKGHKRIGNRMALAATVCAGAFRFIACAVHLENRTDGMGRAAQMHTLLDALDGLADGLPVLIGGDLNTRVEPGRHDDAAEPLFALAARRGYMVAECNRAGITTRSSVWNRRESFPQLDWFLARGLSVSEPAIAPALAPDGTVLSDHEMILLSVAPPA